MPIEAIRTRTRVRRAGQEQAGVSGIAGQADHVLQQLPADAAVLEFRQQGQHQHLAAFAVSKAVAGHPLALPGDAADGIALGDARCPAVLGDAQPGQLRGTEGVFAGAPAQVDAGSGIIGEGIAVVDRHLGDLWSNGTT
ncbi:hypothetical protein D3C72_1795680 [compost metagenome]